MSQPTVRERVYLTSARELLTAARERRADLLDGWHELGVSDPWDVRVLLDADDRTWRMSATCDWPASLAARMEASALGFVHGLKAALDAAVLGTAEVVCAAIGPPPAGTHQMPLTRCTATGSCFADTNSSTT